MFLPADFKLNKFYNKSFVPFEQRKCPFIVFDNVLAMYTYVRVSAKRTQSDEIEFDPSGDREFSLVNPNW